MNRALGSIVGLIVICGAAVYTFGIYNYTLSKDFWSFAPWQFIGVVVLLAVGVLIALSIRAKSFRLTVFFLNVYTVIICFVAIIWGVEAIKNKEILFHHYVISGSDAIYQGKIAIGAGLLGIFTTIFFKIKKKPDEVPLYVICTSCLKPWHSNETSDKACPDCGGGLEDVNGFYNRHPDLKNKQTENEASKSDPSEDIKYAEAKENLKASLNETKERLRASHRKMFTDPYVPFKNEKERNLKVKGLLIVILLMAVALLLLAIFKEPAVIKF